MTSKRGLKNIFSLSPSDLRLSVWSAFYFFLLLSAYYILRPIRETLGIARSADDLPSLFLATMLVTFLLAPLIGALVSKYPRRQFIPIAYYFICSNLVIFFIAFHFVSSDYLFHVGILFYIWLTVINLLLVSLFWGFMADGIHLSKSKQLFPIIAVGGTLGAIVGSSLAQILVSSMGHYNLMLLAIVLLLAAIYVMRKIDLDFNKNVEQSSSLGAPDPALFHQTEPNKTSVKDWVSGINYCFSSPYLLAIAGYIFCYSITSTFIYFQQGILVADATTTTVDRVKIFANIDLVTNLLTLLMQLFISRELLKRFNISLILAGLPLFTLLGFALLGFYPTVMTLVIFQSLRRALNYGLFKPAREILFTILPSEQKYKAKSFLDTFIYRGGDAAGALTQKAFIGLQIGVSSIAIVLMPLFIIWPLLAIYLGRKVNNAHTDIPQQTS